MHTSFGLRGRTRRPNWIATRLGAWFTGLALAGLNGSCARGAAALSAPSFSDGAATGRFAGETGRCWVMLGDAGRRWATLGDAGLARRCWVHIGERLLGSHRTQCHWRCHRRCHIGAIVTTIVLLLLLPYCSTA